MGSIVDRLRVKPDGSFSYAADTSPGMPAASKASYTTKEVLTFLQETVGYDEPTATKRCERLCNDLKVPSNYSNSLTSWMKSYWSGLSADRRGAQLLQFFAARMP
jgi:hypothetical protein